MGSFTELIRLANESLIAFAPRINRVIGSAKGQRFGNWQHVTSSSQISSTQGYLIGERGNESASKLSHRLAHWCVDTLSSTATCRTKSVNRLQRRTAETWTWDIMLELQYWMVIQFPYFSNYYLPLCLPVCSTASWSLSRRLGRQIEYKKVKSNKSILIQFF